MPPRRQPRIPPVNWYRGFSPPIIRADRRGGGDRFFHEERPDLEVTAERRLPGVLNLLDVADALVSAVGRGHDDFAVEALDHIIEGARTLKRRLGRGRKD